MTPWDHIWGDKTACDSGHTAFYFQSIYPESLSCFSRCWSPLLVSPPSSLSFRLFVFLRCSKLVSKRSLFVSLLVFCFVHPAYLSVFFLLASLWLIYYCFSCLSSCAAYWYCPVLPIVTLLCCLLVLSCAAYCYCPVLPIVTVLCCLLVLSCAAYCYCPVLPIGIVLCCLLLLSCAAYCYCPVLPIVTVLCYSLPSFDSSCLSLVSFLVLPIIPCQHVQCTL
jgi:hypothetical protein